MTDAGWVVWPQAAWRTEAWLVVLKQRMTLFFQVGTLDDFPSLVTKLGL